MAKLLRKDVLKWIRNLKDGSYKKTKRTLVSPDGERFCCLGVWADQHGCYWKADSFSRLIPIPPGKKYPSGGQGAGMLKDNISFGLAWTTQTSLARLNDDHKTWKQVIEFIEDKVLPLAK
jgi:hypothetical protein